MCVCERNSTFQQLLECVIHILSGCCTFAWNINLQGETTQYMTFKKSWLIQIIEIVCFRCLWPKWFHLQNTQMITFFSWMVDEKRVIIPQNIWALAIGNAQWNNLEFFYIHNHLHLCTGTFVSFFNNRNVIH